MYKTFLLLSVLCISLDSADDNSAAAAESHKGTFPRPRVVATASSERDLSRFTFWVMLPHWYLNFFKWLSMHFWALIFRQTLGSPPSPGLLQDQPYINIVSYRYWDQQRPIPFRLFSPFLFFFKKGQTGLYQQPSVSLSFRPSNSSIHYREPSSPRLHDSAIKMTY